MADHQGSLFNEPPRTTLRDILDAAPAPADPNVSEAAKPRLTGQNAAILERLRQGPATLAELVAIAPKYTSRISDLRHAGHRIRCDNDPTTGQSIYTLER